MSKPQVIDLAQQSDGSHALAVVTPPSLSVPDILTLARELVPTGFLPETIRTPGQAMAIVLAGQELGLPAMQSLRSIVLVKGKVTLSAELMLSLAVRAGVRHQWTATSDTSVTLRLTRAGFAPHDETFTMEDARRAGLAGGMYGKYPRNMLRARCVSNAVRAYCPEVLLGVYVTGELDDPIAEPDAPAAPVPTPTPPVDPYAGPDGKHADSWEADRPRFCAEVGRLLPEVKNPYEAVKAFTLDRLGFKPSSMNQRLRDKVLSRLGTPEGRDAFLAWASDAPLDTVIFRAGDEPQDVVPATSAPAQPTPEPSAQDEDLPF